jgi:hypothetical protein
MVDVSVRQEHGGERPGIESEVSIPAHGLVSPPLKKPAIQQEPASRDFEEMTASRDRPRCAVKG